MLGFLDESVVLVEMLAVMNVLLVTTLGRCGCSRQEYVDEGDDPNGAQSILTGTPTLCEPQMPILKNASLELARHDDLYFGTKSTNALRS